MDTDYKSKIRKLLALARSPEEHEARAALLMARKLMAEHKITEGELGDPEKQKVKDVRTDITCSKRRNPWIVDLSAVIGESYCCKAYRNHQYGRQTQTIGFIGFEEDVELCIDIFKYAVDCVLSGIERVKEENAVYFQSYVKQCCDAYGYGFTRGCAVAFDRQKEEHKDEWGLVLVLPKEVQEAARHLKKGKFEPRIQGEIPPTEYAEGYMAGKDFDPHRRLKAQEVGK